MAVPSSIAPSTSGAWMEPARASVRVMTDSTRTGSRSGGRWSRPGVTVSSQPSIRAAACRLDSISGG